MSKGDDLTQYDGDGEVDDGFNAAFSSDRTIKGVQLAWNDSLHWRTRDGMKAPEQLLVIAIDAILQRWKEGLPHVIREKPLPHPDDLNAAIPTSAWEVGIDGKPRPPWQDTVVVYLIDPLTGGFYTFVSSTTGARISVDHLKESTMGMRTLRGERVLPVVSLSERPMKTKFGVKSRPHFEIVGWKEPLGPKLEAEPMTALPSGSEAKSEPEAQPAPAAKTARRGLRDVAPASSSEVVNDAIPY